METKSKPSWESLREDQQQAWIQQVINFYLPTVISPDDALELAKEEYADSETLLPAPEVAEPD